MIHLTFSNQLVLFVTLFNGTGCGDVLILFAECHPSRRSCRGPLDSLVLFEAVNNTQLITLPSKNANREIWVRQQEPF